MPYALKYSSPWMKTVTQKDLVLSSPAVVFIKFKPSINSLYNAKNPTGTRMQTQIIRPSEQCLCFSSYMASRLFSLCQISMSVRSEHITVTDMLPAPTQLEALNATVLQGGLATASNVQVRLMRPEAG